MSETSDDAAACYRSARSLQQQQQRRWSATQLSADWQRLNQHCVCVCVCVWDGTVLYQCSSSAAAVADCAGSAAATAVSTLQTAAAAAGRVTVVSRYDLTHSLAVCGPL